MQSYAELANLTISAPNGVDYSYRDTGGRPETAPLVLLQHFRGNLDYGGSTGETPDTIEQMARDAIAFITALGHDPIDLRRPALIRRLVLASSAPKGAPGMHGWAPAVIGAIGKETLGRIFGSRTSARDEMTGWATRGAQYDAVCAWGIPDHSALERLAAIEMPVLVANGDSDPMISPRYSHDAEFAADVARFLDFAE